jgi:capsular exopolysaccharide synthesis family protein
MSAQENSIPTSDLSPEQAITIQPSAIAAYPAAADWSAAGEGDQPQGSGMGLDVLLHAIRRHWLVIAAAGVAVAAVVGTLAFFAIKPKYEAQAVLLVAPKNPFIYSGNLSDETTNVADEFNIFRNNQAALLKQRFVIQAALRNNKLKNQPSVVREDARHNAVPWLTSLVQVNFEKNSGVMYVSATLPDPNESATIVNAVVAAYMEEVVNVDRLKRRDRFDSLQRVAADKEEEVRRLREQLKRELEALGAGDDQTASLRGQMAVSIFAEYQRELQKLKFDRNTLQGKLEGANEMTKILNDPDPRMFRIPDTELAAVLSNNPVYKDLLPRQQMLQSIVAAQQPLLVPGAKQSPTYKRAKQELDSTNDAVAKLEQKADLQVRDAKRVELEREIYRLKAEINIATEQIVAFQKEVDSKSRDADSVGKSSVSAQMQRANLENVERILKGVVEERERLKVELQSAPRVAVWGDDKNAPAAVPEQESGTGGRYALVLAASFFGMLLPGVGIVVWDLRKRRVNSTGDVAKKLRIPVMGTLPYIPPTVMRRLGGSTRRSQLWKMRYTEAVDGVVARLLHSAEGEEARVVMVTSAMSGEGKTWLATQLAMGLARAQKSTVLVDFDLRQPALNGALGLPLGPGVCEALRGQGDIAQMVQPTDTEYLSVVTAGNWDRQVLPALANGSVCPLLERLRENFDFVIIDSSPLLPVVDSRLICRRVDAVLLSVLRDVSEASKVQAAQEMLDAFGVSQVQAVVTSGEHHGHAKNLLLHAALVDEQKARPDDEQPARFADDVPLRGDTGING